MCHLQRNKTIALSPAGFLVPLGIPHAVWKDITMDFIKELPKAKGYQTILVVVDRLSKYNHFIGLQHPFTAKTVVSAFIKEIVKLHDYPYQLYWIETKFSSSISGLNC